MKAKGKGTAKAKVKARGKARRTTHRSTTGKKLYAVRDAAGQFKDIQTYERAHRADLAKTAKGEVAARRKRARKKAAQKKG